MKNTLENLRKQLDAIDNELLTLLSKRMTIVTQVGMIKKEKGIPPLDKKRWEEVLSSRTQIGKQLGLSEKFIQNIWDFIHKDALEKERNI